MKKLAKRFAIGAMAAVMALSAFSAQAAVSGDYGVSPPGQEVPQELSDAILYHSLGYDYENYGNYVEVSGSPVTVNAYSGNLYFQLADLPIALSYNSLGDNNVGYGPNFMSDSHIRLERREDGSFVYYEGTGEITHFTYNADRGELVDERNWTLQAGGSNYMYGYMNTKPWLIFDYDGQFYKRSTRLQSGSYLTTMTVTHNQYGMLTETDYQGRKVTYEYYNGDTLVHMIKSITSDGVKYVMIYNDQGNLLRVETASGETYLELDYDASGMLVTRIGSTHIQYDAQGRAVNVKTYKTTGGLQENMSFSYSNNSTVVTKTNGASEIMNFDLDGSRLYR